MHPYRSMDTATAWKKSCFILLDRSDFHKIDSLSIAFHAFARCISTSLSVDDILLPRYVNWFTDFRGLPLRLEIAPFCLKYMKSVCFHPHRDQCFLLFAQDYCSRDSVWAGVFVRSTQTSAPSASVIVFCRISSVSCFF